MRRLIAQNLILLVVVSMLVVSALLLRGVGRWCASSRLQPRAAKLGTLGLRVISLTPPVALLALVSLVLRARLTIGQWPRLGTPRLDGHFLWVRDGFKASEFPVHHSTVLWCMLVALVSPLLAPAALSFLSGLGEPARWKLVVVYAAWWLAYVVVLVVDPECFVDWAVPDRLFD
jgi:hypothetical protein